MKIGNNCIGAKTQDLGLYAVSNVCPYPTDVFNAVSMYGTTLNCQSKFKKLFHNSIGGKIARKNLNTFYNWMAP